MANRHAAVLKTAAWVALSAGQWWVVMCCVKSRLVTVTNSERSEVLSRKFRSAENFGPGTEIPGKSVLPGPKFSKIFENFGPCVEKWSAQFEIYNAEKDADSDVS